MFLKILIISNLVKNFPVVATRSYRMIDRRQSRSSQWSFFAILGTHPKQVISNYVYLSISKTDCKIVTIALGSRDLLIKFGVEKDRSAFIRHDFI